MQKYVNMKEKPPAGNFPAGGFSVFYDIFSF